MIDAQYELILVTETAPAILRGLLREVDDDQAHRHAAATEWSLTEIVGHLIDAEERAVERVQIMAGEDEPPLYAYDQEILVTKHGYAEAALSELLPRFEQLRAERVAALRALAPADWSRLGHHNQIGPISIQQLMAHMATHDAVHLAQIARLIAMS